MQKYRAGGLSSLLEIKKAAGATRKLNSEALTALKQELEIGRGFNSYGEIVEWLKHQHGLDIEYGTVYAWVRYQLKAKLKVPRPQSCQQNEELGSELKKTRHHSTLNGNITSV